MVAAPARRRQEGALLLGLLLFLLVTSLVASALVQNQFTSAQRLREEQLLFVGDQYRRAITSYYNTIQPGGHRQLPQRLEQLVRDERTPRPVQHLRRLYPDPMTGRMDWDLVTASGGISGVRSSSKSAPLRKSGFNAEDSGFASANSYNDWIFLMR